MGRILSIDYGQKNVGLAVTDELKIIATALDTIHVKEIHQYIKNYLSTHEVERFVVGLPKTLQNIPSESTPFVENFVSWLSNTFPQIPISRVDERFTSKMASQIIQQSGKSKKGRSDKTLIDRISATIILQSYLETI